jgi:hypothetical protein
VLHALRDAHLIKGDDDGLRWVGDPAKTHRVKFYGKTYSVPDKDPRRESRDRYMLGDPDKDWMSPSLGAEGRVLRGDTPPLKVKVRTQWRGQERIHEEALEIHPIALAIPPMTPDEQKAVRENIAKHGVKVPLVLFPDKDDLTVKGNPKRKVLDGRHRAYFASVTGRSVTTEEFVGTEEEARDHVASLNLHRRQLTRQQRALAAERLYGAQARKEATEAQRKGNSRGGKSPTNLTETSNGQERGREAHERVWEMAGGPAAGFSKADAKAAATVAQAPETSAKVDSGEIKKTSAALAEAKAEIADQPVDHSAGNNVSAPMSALILVGKARYNLRLLKQEWDDSEVLADREEIGLRAGEIIDLAEWILDHLTAAVR